MATEPNDQGPEMQYQMPWGHDDQSMSNLWFPMETSFEGNPYGKLNFVGLVMQSVIALVCWRVGLGNSEVSFYSQSGGSSSNCFLGNLRDLKFLFLLRFSSVARRNNLTS